MNTLNLCFEQKYEKYQNFLSKKFHFLLVKFSSYLNRHRFVMKCYSFSRFQDFRCSISKEMFDTKFPTLLSTSFRKFFFC